MYYALIRAFQRWYRAQQRDGFPNYFARTISDIGNRNRPVYWYQAQQRDGFPSFLARIIRDIQKPTSGSGWSETRIITDIETGTSQSGWSDIGNRAPSSGNLPSRPPDIEFWDPGGTGSTGDLVGATGNLIMADFLALGISQEFMEFLNRTDGISSGDVANMDRPKADIRKFFTALEVLTGQKLCPDCGFLQPETNKGPSCLNCDVAFEVSPFLDSMKARAERDFLTMTGIEFEHEIARLFTLRGYQMQVTQASHDGGIDIVGSAPGIGEQKVAVQCKRYATTTIGIAEIQRFWGIIASSEYATGFFVTTSSFTSDSLQFSKDKPRLVLIDGRELQKWRSV